MPKLHQIVLAVLLIAAVITTSSCGKISAPSAIEGSGYPHSYPRN